MSRDHGSQPQAPIAAHLYLRFSTVALVRKISGLTILALLLTSAAFAEPEANYRVNCSQCHGADGAGKTNFASRARVPDLRSKEVQDMTDEEIYSSIARGTRHKNYPHAFEMRGMTKADIKLLVGYIRTMKK